MDIEMFQRRTTLSRFWCGPHLVPLNVSGHGESLHSLVLAAGTTKTLLDCLIAAGADSSFWGTTAAVEALPEERLPPSALCVSTPFHQAIPSER
jgi:hypothetical protein